MSRKEWILYCLDEVKVYYQSTIVLSSLNLLLKVHHYNWCANGCVGTETLQSIKAIPPTCLDNIPYTDNTVYYTVDMTRWLMVKNRFKNIKLRYTFQ